MPQAMEWSLATPITSPRLPSISPGMSLTRTYRRPARPCAGPPIAISRLQPLEHDRCISAAEPERVRQLTAKLRVAPLAHDRHVGEGRIHRLDVCALADEAVVHHQQRVDRLLGTGRTE